MTEDLGDGTLDAVRVQREGLRVALSALERAVAAPSTGREKEWVTNVQDRLGMLADSFAHHVAVTESRDGLFDEVISHAPRLAPRVAKLRDEHATLSQYLAALTGPFRGVDPVREVEDLREGVLGVMGGVVRHRHMGSSLIYEAYFVDVEAAD
jgi:hypothetical protein